MGSRDDRALGVWLGQLSGDALGSQVEFASSVELQRRYPGGLDTMSASAVWKTMPGQPTDDSELAIELALALIESKPRFDIDHVARHYMRWMQSRPFDAGWTISQALSGPVDPGQSISQAIMARANPNSQANGALMRQSPLAIWGAVRSPHQAAECARLDAALTHPHAVCREASAVFVATLSEVIAHGLIAMDAYQYAIGFQRRHGREATVLYALEDATDKPPPISVHSGHVVLALHNAFYRILHCDSLKEVIVASVMLGGDTDTNAAIAGALAGGIYGAAAIPAEWRQAIDQCKPGVGSARPRPERYWPGSYQSLVRGLLNTIEN